MQDTLVMIAFARLFVPDALLPATTAMGSLHKRGRELALQAGANVVMPNLSPTMVRPKYELYENKICTGDESAACRACIELRINAAGFTVDMQRGDSVRLFGGEGRAMQPKSRDNPVGSCQTCESYLHLF